MLPVFILALVTSSCLSSTPAKSVLTLSCNLDKASKSSGIFSTVSSTSTISVGFSDKGSTPGLLVSVLVTLGPSTEILLTVSSL